MTEFETLKFAQSGAVVNIVLDRPEAANGMNDALTRDLAKAAALCDTAGVKVVMNRCPKIEYGRLSAEIGWFGVNSRTISSRRAPAPTESVQKLSLDRQSIGGGETPAATRARREEPGGE